MACSKSPKNMVDFFGNAPDIVIDKILESLPIRMAARTSVLSKQWRHAWLSLKKLNFDADFWEEQKNIDESSFWRINTDESLVWRKGFQIISDILLCHNGGPVHDFDLNIPYEACRDHRDRRDHRPWISFLSKHGVRKIVIRNCSFKMKITTDIFRCENLKSISLDLKKLPKKPVTVETVDAVNLVASSCQLRSIKFDGHFCKFLAAGGIIRSPPVTFNHLDELCLSNLNLSDFGIFQFLLYMIEGCPRIKKLDISVFPGENVGQDMPNYNYNNKLDHLIEVNITGITGTIAEIKLVEYVLAISPVLKSMFFKFGYISIESQLDMSQSLMRFPRASTKASLVCLKK